MSYVVPFEHHMYTTYRTYVLSAFMVRNVMYFYIVKFKNKLIFSSKDKLFRKRVMNGR